MIAILISLRLAFAYDERKTDGTNIMNNYVNVRVFVEYGGKLYVLISCTYIHMRVRTVKDASQSIAIYIYIYSIEFVLMAVTVI